MQKSYYAIIPANVRYDKDLTPNAKLLYGEITALCNEKGYCWASNSYFSELYSVSTRSASKWINQLIEKGYVTSELIYQEGKKEVKNRHLRIGVGIEEKFHTSGTKVHDPIEEKFHTPIEEKFQDNNTVINTTSNTTKEVYIQFAEFVKLKESEHKSLVAKYGAEPTKKMIEVLDNYKGANDKKYKSDYRAILSWVADKVANQKGGVRIGKVETSEFGGTILPF